MKETANRYTIALLSVIAVLALAAFSAPASATCPCVTIDNDTINGGIYYKTYDAWPGTGGSGNYIASHTFTGVPAGVKTARVHAGVWMLDPGNVNITVNGNSSGPENAPDCDCDSININKTHSYCTGYGVHFITYDATADIPAGGGNIPVTVESTSAGDGRIYMIGLLVVYENESMANMTYWINEGAWYTGDGQAVVNFNGSYPSGVTDVTYWTLGMPYGITTNPLLNTYDIGTPDYSESGYYNFWRWDNIDTDNLTAPNNQMVHPVSGGDWQRLDAAVLRLLRSPSDLPDLIATDIEFPEVMRPDTNYTINATIKNQGSGAANASTATLYVDDVPNGTASVPTLNASDSTTVNFTVNLPEGCYTFKVVADSAGVIGESDENNNATSENYQVGYVIVVRSNSDFADLVTEGLAREDGGTYYIENRTITNCAGNGITIENTTVSFVIDNCTVQNCGDSGIYLYNLTNGTVNGSEVNDNTLSGIEVQKGSTYVDLTNNTVEGNTMYGIEVGEVPLDSDDPNYVTIKNNTISNTTIDVLLVGFNFTVSNNTILNNTDYAIYLYGNDSNITGNTLKDNTGYAIKAYNSSRNNIYCNTFADNNAGSPGHQAWDNGNTNNWNSTELSKNYIGNRWKDWKDNSGYPYNYTIDGGSNVDERPKGFYDFLTGASDDKWAFKDEVGANPPVNDNGVPNEEFSSSNPDEYGYIEADDEDEQIDDSDSNGNYAAHRFNFTISEDPDDISEINVTWHGRGYHDSNPDSTYDGAYLYIWNGTGYEELANNSGVGTDATLTGVNATAASNYVNGDNVTVLVVQKSPQTRSKYSHIETDYVRLVVTP